MFLNFMVVFTTFFICFMVGYVIAKVEKHFAEQRRNSYEKKHKHPNLSMYKKRIIKDDDDEDAVNM